jgi:hypothetical protein
VWRMVLVPLGGMLVASCATTSRLHEGQTALASSESAAATAGAQKGGGDGFRRLWRSPGLKPWRLLKWDQDHSTAASGSPAALLQAIREEVGRLNQRPASGDDLLLTCTVYLYRGGGWFSDPKAHYELVARNQAGKALWVADDEVVAKPDLARSLADPEEAIIAREIARKIRKAFGL